MRRNDIVLISPWLLHRHEKLWSDPNAFIPQRFMAPAPPPDRFAYLPFGVGARVCIGAHFALVEATLALAKMIGAFRIIPHNSTSFHLFFFLRSQSRGSRLPNISNFYFLLSTLCFGRRPI